MLLHINTVQATESVPQVVKNLKEGLNLRNIAQTELPLVTERIKIDKQCLAYSYPENTCCKKLLENANPVHLALSLIAAYAACIYTQGANLKKYYGNIEHILLQIQDQCKTEELSAFIVEFNAKQLNHFVNLLNENQPNIKTLQELACEPNATNIERRVKKTLRDIVSNMSITPRVRKDMKDEEWQEFDKLQEKIATLGESLKSKPEPFDDPSNIAQEMQASSWSETLGSAKQFLYQFFYYQPVPQQRLTKQEEAALGAINKTTTQLLFSCLQSAVNSTEKALDDPSKNIATNNAPLFQTAQGQQINNTKPNANQGNAGLEKITRQTSFDSKTTTPPNNTTGPQKTENTNNPEHQSRLASPSSQKNRATPESLSTKRQPPKPKIDRGVFFRHAKNLRPRATPVILASLSGALTLGLTYAFAPVFPAIYAPLLAIGALLIVFTAASFLIPGATHKQTTDRADPEAASEQQSQSPAKKTNPTNDVGSAIENADAEPAKTQENQIVKSA